MWFISIWRFIIFFTTFSLVRIKFIFRFSSLDLLINFWFSATIDWAFLDSWIFDICWNCPTSCDSRDVTSDFIDFLERNIISILHYYYLILYLPIQARTRDLSTGENVQKWTRYLLLFFFRCVRATSMTQRRVENTRVHFWSFSLESVNIILI